MFKKLLILVFVLVIVGMACIPLWTTMMAEKAFENPTQKMSPEAVRDSIKVKMYIYLFEDARKISEKAVIYFPESPEMPFFIYNAAICSDKIGNKDAAYTGMADFWRTIRNMNGPTRRRKPWTS